jgi:hypothetical protein
MISSSVPTLQDSRGKLADSETGVCAVAEMGKRSCSFFMRARVLAEQGAISLANRSRRKNSIAKRGSRGNSVFAASQGAACFPFSWLEC